MVELRQERERGWVVRKNWAAGGGGGGGGGEREGERQTETER